MFLPLYNQLGFVVCINMSHNLLVLCHRDRLCYFLQQSHRHMFNELLQSYLTHIFFPSPSFTASTNHFFTSITSIHTIASTPTVASIHHHFNTHSQKIYTIYNKNDTNKKLTHPAINRSKNSLTTTWVPNIFYHRYHF